MGKAWKHFKTITAHRHKVMMHCFKVGLYYQGLTHDLSKYSWKEFRTGIHYYQGDRSPNTAEKLDKGYSVAWLHHKGRNLHHLEYWIDYSPNRQEGFSGMKMPIKYVVEMFCDRMAACKIYQQEKYTDNSPLAYFKEGQQRYGSLFHPKSQELLEHLLIMLSEKGEKATFCYIKKEILTKKAPIALEYDK